MEPLIYLVRHGETALNAARILPPPATPPSERGVAQAERVAARLAGAGLVRILVSDLRRAEMTAEAIARASGAPLARDPDLAERNFGALRGRPYAELGLDPFAPDYEPPERELPAAWHETPSAGLTAGDVELSAWWRNLDDPVLDQLVARATRQSLDLREALWRVQEARALRR